MLLKGIQTLCVLVISLGSCVWAAAGAPNTSATKIDTLEIETLLSNLGYWIMKVDKRPDTSTYHAIVAFKKVERLKRNGVLSPTDIETLRFATRPTAKHNTGAKHVEVDITRQVLFLVDASGEVQLVLPVSTGNEKRYFDQGKWQVAHTPRGRFKIQRKVNGVRKASLGNLYYPNYFHEGVAIHGSNSIPIFPASHGCVRIPRFADKAFASLVTIGMEVYVYD